MLFYAVYDPYQISPTVFISSTYLPRTRSKGQLNLVFRLMHDRLKECYTVSCTTRGSRCHRFPLNEPATCQKFPQGVDPRDREDVFWTGVIISLLLACAATKTYTNEHRESKRLHCHLCTKEIIHEDLTLWRKQYYGYDNGTAQRFPKPHGRVKADQLGYDHIGSFRKPPKRYQAFVANQHNITSTWPEHTGGSARQGIGVPAVMRQSRKYPHGYHIFPSSAKCPFLQRAANFCAGAINMFGMP